MTEQPEDPIAALDDRFARGVARTVVHVRRFLTFYAGGLGFAIALAMAPVVHGGGGGTPASAVGPGGAAGAAGSVGRAVAAPGGSSATPAGGAAAGRSTIGSAASSLAAAAGDAVETGLDGGAAGAVGGGSGAVGSGRGPALPAGPGVPETPETPDFGDDEVAAPELCMVEPPSPAPAVSPEREITSAQDTAEAAARTDAPVDIGATASPVLQQAVCGVPDAQVETPAVPVPAAPVSAGAAPTPLQVAFSLLPY